MSTPDPSRAQARKSPMESFANFICEHRKAVLVFSALVTVAGAAFATRLKVDTNFANYLSPTDPVIMRAKAIGRTFGGNYTAVVLIESKDTFTPAILHGIARLTKAFARAPGVASVVSLTNVVDIRKTDQGLDVSDLIPDEAVLDQPAKLAALRRYTLAKSAYDHYLVSPDGRYSAIYVKIAEAAAKDVVAKRLRSITESVWPAAHRPAEISYAGEPMLMDYLDHIVMRDMAVLVPLIILLLVGILYLSFRTLRGVVLPLAAVTMATVVTLGIMGLAGAPLTLIAAIMPVVLMSNGSAYGIHMLNFITLSHATEPDSRGAVRSALRLVAVPITLSAVTTFIGFLSFVAGLLTIFQNFGIYTAIGIAGSLFFALTFIPAVASGLKPPRTVGKADGQVQAAASFVNRPLGSLARHLDNHPRLVLAAVLLTVVAIVPGIFRVRSDFNMLGFFSKTSEPRRADDVMTREFGGTMSYEIHIRGPVKNPLVLEEMYRLHEHLRATLHSRLVNSIADVIADMNDQLNGQRAIPPTKAGIDSLYLLLEGKSQLKQLVTPAADQALIVGRLPRTSSAVTLKRVAAVNRLLKKELRPRLVELPWKAVQPTERPALARLVAHQLLDDLGADLAYAGRRLSDPAALRPLFEAAVGRPAAVAALPKDVRRETIAAYFATPDCDLDVEAPADRARLTAALTAVDPPSRDAFAAKIRATAPIIARDTEGVKLAAAAVQRLLTEAATHRDHERLVQAILAASAPSTKPSGHLTEELLGELSRLTAKGWPVTPEQYARLAGQKANPASVVHIAATQSGNAMVMATILDRVVGSQIRSLLLCLGLVLIVMIIQLRSLKGGVIAMVPIIFTLAFNFGLMGYLGITLNVVTALIASLAIGIGIDYTIHTSYRIRAEVAHGGSRRRILERVYLSTGRAVLINALAVVAGFLVIVASEISALRIFGWLSALSISMSAVGALTVYPVLIMILDRRYITPAARAPTESQSLAPTPQPSQGGTP